MKKILLFFIILLFPTTNIFAYSPVNIDFKILNNIYEKIDPICEKSPKSCENLIIKIDKIKNKYTKKPRIYYILGELKEHLKNTLNTKKVFLDKKNNFKKSSTIIGNKVYISKVVDGDTVHFIKDKKDFTARLIGIDAPENSKTRYGHIEKLGNNAKNYLQKLINNKYVIIEYDNSQAKTDKYGRHLIYIFLGNQNINQKLIEVGLAKEYTYNKAYKYQKEFKYTQNVARQKKLGIWSLSQYNQYRVIKEISNHSNTNSKCKIKGNINSKGKKIYHLPTCRSYNQTKISTSKGEKWFCSESEAKKAGWNIAGNCN